MTELPIEAEDFPAVIVKFDNEGTIEYASPNIQSLMGFTPEEVVGKNFFDVFEGQPETNYDFLKNAERGHAVFLEHSLLTPEGEKYFSWQICGIEGGGNIALGFDMTHCKRKMDLLMNAISQAESASQAKTDFIAHTSHELRTPLNAVIGYSEMLLDEVEEASPADIKIDLEKINSAARHLLSLINSVLDLTKIEAGRMELYNEQFDVAELLQEVASTAETLIQRNSNSFEILISKELGAMYADRTKLREILFNLLSNASKFTENGQIRLSCEPSNGIVIFEVADTGYGMSQKEQSLLFKPYTQFKHSDRKGTGLGLLLCQQLSQLMKGEIEITSEENKGTTVRVKLPLVYQSPSERRISYSDIVLVIDDDPSAHEIVGHVLKKQGLKMVSAMNGPEGLRLAKECRPLAIILDLIMPGMDGWEVLQQIKQDPDLCDTPVVISTVDDTTPKAKLAMKVDDYLLKPINSKLLESILNRYRPEGSKTFSMMVVDDDPEARTIIMRLAEKQGCEVREARNGVEAIEKLYGYRPDLILLDLLMPEMNGFEFVQHFRKHENWRDIPIVVLTSKKLTREDREYLGLYVQTLLEKESGGYQEIEEIIREISQRG